MVVVVPRESKVMIGSWVVVVEDVEIVVWVSVVVVVPKDSKVITGSWVVVVEEVETVV